jgi:hypothetical protein
VRSGQKGSQILYSKVEHLRARPVGRPPKRPIALYYRMTGHGAKTWTGDEKSLVAVRRKSARMGCFQPIGVSGGLWGGLIGRVDGQKG